MSTFASSFRFSPNNITRLSKLTPSEISFDDFIKYFMIGRVPEKKLSFDFNRGNDFVSLKDKRCLSRCGP